jgi:hypothetical protein
MFCNSYNKSLTDACASGEQLSFALTEHLAACESCRSAFVEQQSLFAAINSGLRAVANSEVPATLVPRVRVGIVDAPQPRRFSFSFLASVGGTAAAAAIVASFYLQSHVPSTRVATNSAAASSPAAQANPSSPSSVNPLDSGGVFPLRHDTTVALVVSRGPRPESPEVIVAPEEGAALLRYEMLLRRTRATGLQALSSNRLDLQMRIEPLEIAEIDLGELKIQPLTKSDSEGDSRKR